MGTKIISKMAIFFLFFLTIFLSFKTDLSSLPQTKQKPLEYEVEVVLIEVPVYVVDKKGNPVLDLEKENFVLYEDGKEQTITHFALIQNDSPEIASLARRYPGARRQFFLLFDLSFSSPRGILRAREAGLNFVRENILSHDLVAVATFSVLHGIQILSNFTNDKAQLDNAVESLGLIQTTQIAKDPVGFLFSPVITPTSFERDIESQRMGSLEDQLETLSQQLRTAKWESYKGYVQDYVGAFKTLGQALDIIKGRKHLILFSEGFDIKVLTGKTLKELSEETEAIAADRVAISRADKDRFGDPTIRLAIDQALKQVSSSDCLIHTIDVGGLRATGDIDDTREKDAYFSTRRGQDTLHLLSADTGGKAFRNVNELDKPLEDLLKLTNSYYLLGYYPSKTRRAGKFRNLKVEVLKPDLQLSHRKGYYEEKSFDKYTDFEKRLQLVELITKDIYRDEIEVESSIIPFEGTEEVARASIFLKFPGYQFLERKEKNIRFEIYGYAIDSTGRFRDFFHNPLNIDLKLVKDEPKSHGIKYFDLLLVPPGEYKIKFVIQNSNTGETSTIISELSVPKYDDQTLIMSPPIFIEKGDQWLSIPGYNPLKPTGRKEGEGLPIDYPFSVGGEDFLPGINPTFYAHSQGQFILRIHNLKLHPTAKIPQTDMKFEVIDENGLSHKAVKILSIKPFQPKPNLFELLFQYELEPLPAGRYQLKVTLTDTLSEQTAAASSPFVYK